MRIVVLINGLGVGGGERLAASTAGELRRRGHAVDLFCLSRGGSVADELAADGFAVERLSWEGVLRPAGWWSLRRALGAADVLHSHFYYSDLVARLARRWVKIRRLVSTRHDTGITLRPGHAAAEPWIYRAFDRVLCVSEAVRAGLARRGTSPARLEVLRPGIDLTLPATAAPPVPEPFLLFAGRLERIKGPDLLLDAFARLTGDDDRPLHLVFAGDGPLRRALAAESARRGLAARVTFLGPVPHAQVGALMRRARALVVPSRDDAAPLVLLEAMAAGVVCVATAVGGVGELVTDGVNGLLVAPGSAEALAVALARVTGDAPLAARLAAAGRARVQAEHGLPAYVDRLVDVYRGA